MDTVHTQGQGSFPYVINSLANVASFSKKLVILCTFTILVKAKSGYFLQSFVSKMFENLAIDYFG